MIYLYIGRLIIELTCESPFLSSSYLFFIFQRTRHHPKSLCGHTPMVAKHMYKWMFEPWLLALYSHTSNQQKTHVFCVLYSTLKHIIDIFMKIGGK
jgi:hypothetical protein